MRLRPNAHGRPTTPDLLLDERLHLATGSIVVPGDMGFVIIQPLAIVSTIANAFATYRVESLSAAS